jgi:hypothetical protein
MLYEVGDYVNRNGRHRHTHYIISHSEILGYTPQQRRIIAGDRALLGKSRPVVSDGTDESLASVPTEYLCAKLHFCCASRVPLIWDVAMLYVSSRLHMRQGGVQIELYSGPRASLDLELWALEKRKGLFPGSFWARAFRCRCVKGTQDFGSQTPVQDAGIASDFHPRYCALFQIHSRLAAVLADAASPRIRSGWGCALPP